MLGMQDAELLQKLKQVEENAWLLFSELPPSGARTRALHVFLDAKDMKARLERLAALLDQPANRCKPGLAEARAGAHHLVLRPAVLADAEVRSLARALVRLNVR